MPVLFSPGPVAVSPGVRAAAAGEHGHRTEHARRCHREVCRMLLRLTTAGSQAYGTVPLPASGTGANEAVLSALGAVLRTNLVLSNGEFGERLAAQSRECFPVTAVHRVDPARPIDSRLAARALAAHPDAQAISLVWCETSTGLLNDVAGVARAAADRGAPVFADAVSAVGVVPTHADGAGVAFMTGVSGKGIAAYPGISFCTYSLAALARLRAGGLTPRRRYLDLLRNIEEPDAEEFPVTPPTSVLWGLHAALEELLAEGVDRRAARHTRLADLVRAELMPLGFTPLLDAGVPQNPGVLALRLPPGVRRDTLDAALRRHDVVVRSRGDALSRTVLLLGLMGALDDGDAARLVDAVREGRGGSPRREEAVAARRGMP
jgi:2-aminoethylphosphonate-pyruvate transaminase